MSANGARREEILETAASLFASSGMQTTLHEIAAGCGILPGSLYHHFESKESIIVELVRRYRDELDLVAKEALGALHEPDQRPVEQRVVELGEAIAACAIRHRAALLLTLYEPPTVAGDELVGLAGQAPTAIDEAMFEILRAGRTSGAVRAKVDLTLLAERICQSMLHIAVGVWHRTAAARDLPARKCRILLRGVAPKVPTKAVLDRSAAMQAANAAIAKWGEGEADDRAAHLRAVARSEFGRRGYEATTMRDIAKAARVSTGTVYREFRSKDELLLSIMLAYPEHVSAGWDAVMCSRSSSLERLDALLWINVNIANHFSEQSRIQLAWRRQSPPSSADVGPAYGQQLEQLQQLLVAGEEAGELDVEGDSARTRALSLFELILMPELLVRQAGLRPAHNLARESVLRGAIARS